MDYLDIIHLCDKQYVQPVSCNQLLGHQIIIKGPVHLY